MGSIRRWLAPAVALFVCIQKPASAQEAASRLDTETLRRFEWARHTARPDVFRLADSTVALVGLDDDRPVYFGIANEDAAMAIGARDVAPEGSLGIALSGAGVTVGLWDDGPAWGGHQELYGRILDLDGGYPSNHATHVAGTIAARGVDPLARGMAPDAGLRSHDWLLHGSELLDDAHEGLLISNHSYSRIAGWNLMRESESSTVWYWFGDAAVSEVEDYTFGYYDRDASLFDAVTYTYPYLLPVVAAGNDRDDTGPAAGRYRALDPSNRWTDYDATQRPIGPDGDAEGYDTISSFALAKNVLTVGAMPAVRDAAQPSYFSSFGPTDDGRIKPDLVAPGEALYSSIAAGPAAYSRSSGTSMAAPTVTGSLALLQQLAIETRGAPLRAATLKGLVLHTARDMGQPGPDYATGWGALDVREAARVVLDARRDALALGERTLSNRQPDVFDLRVDVAGPLRITASWTDRPGEPIAASGAGRLDNRTPQLRTDLDIRLTHLASGIEYAPFVLDPEHPGEPASTGDNRVDPIEQIALPEAAPGAYRLTVRAKPGSAETEAFAYSLLVSGLRVDEAPVVLREAGAERSDGVVRIRWSVQQERLDGAYVVERAGLDKGDPFDAPQSAVYQSVARIPATAGDGVYAVVDPGATAGAYRYRVFFDQPRANMHFPVAELNVEVPTPERLAVHAVFPNPIRGTSTVVYDVPHAQHIVVDLVDMLGRSAGTLLDGWVEAGKHTATLDGETLAAGVYVLRVVGEAGSSAKTITRLP
ncbi:MAG: S8 family serine peptidase [Rhodothermales bacterium]